MTEDSKTLLDKIHDLPIIQPIWDFVRAQLRYRYLYGFRLWCHFIIGGVIPKDQLRLENPHVVDIITIAFNNPTVIRHQIRLLRKNFQDPFLYTVFDNSSKPKARKEIEEVCRQAGVSYYSLPKPWRADKLFPSDSHGIALN